MHFRHYQNRERAKVIGSDKACNNVIKHIGLASLNRQERLGQRTEKSYKANPHWRGERDNNSMCKDGVRQKTQESCIELST